jgi:hypothetical protein
VAPYRLTGLLALSVDSATTRLIFLSMQASIRFIAPIDVGLDAFERVVLGSRDYFGGGGMHYMVNAIQRPVEALPVTDVADKKTHTGVAFEFLCHFPLFHLIAGVDDQLFRIVFGEGHRHEGMTKGACAASH